MTIYTVTNKSTGTEIYRYVSDAPIAWDGMGFDTHDHAAPVDASPITDATPRMESGRDLTKRAFRLLFSESEQKAIDRFNATFESNTYLTDDQRDDVRTGLENYKAASSVNLDDPDTGKVLGLYTALGILAVGRAQEILA